MIKRWGKRPRYVATFVSRNVVTFVSRILVVYFITPSCTRLHDAHCSHGRHCKNIARGTDGCAALVPLLLLLFSFCRLYARLLSNAQGMRHHLTMRSGDGRTILMHAARSGNAMALSEVVEACQSTCDPGTVRGRECVPFLFEVYPHCRFDIQEEPHRDGGRRAVTLMRTDDSSRETMPRSPHRDGDIKAGARGSQSPLAHMSAELFSTWCA